MLVTNKVFAANKVGDVEGCDKLIGKYEKLLKIEKLSENLILFTLENLKGKKLSKSQKLAKSKKKLSKSKNLRNFDAKKKELSFLTLDTRIGFNRL